MAGCPSERLLEAVDRLVRLRLRHEHFGAAAPEQDDTVELVLRLEPPDVVDDLLGQILLVLAFLQVGPVEPLDVLPVEHGGHRLDGAELALDLIEQADVQHARRARSLVTVVLEDVPAAEDQVVETRQGHEIPDRG